jgi:hypothetical protein
VTELESIWKDDGCGFEGTADEVDKHIIEINQSANGQILPIEQIRCWGRTRVEEDS